MNSYSIVGPWSLMTAERSLFATYFAPYVEANPILVAMIPVEVGGAAMAVVGESP